MANETTMLNNLINPQVMADMISAKLETKLLFKPLAKVDDTLVGVPGNTITIPKYAYIGDACLLYTSFWIRRNAKKIWTKAW